VLYRVIQAHPVSQRSLVRRRNRSKKYQRRSWENPLDDQVAPGRYPWALFGLLVIGGVLAILVALPHLFWLLAVHSEPGPAAASACAGGAGTERRASAARGGIGASSGAEGRIRSAAARRSGSIDGPCRSRPSQRQDLALVIGLAVSLAVVALDVVFLPHVPDLDSLVKTQLQAPAAAWKRLLACFYGGIIEELLVRPATTKNAPRRGRS
jgi:hypothetical protein